MIRSEKIDNGLVEGHHGRCDSIRVVAKTVIGVAKLVAALAALVLNGSLFILSVIAVCVGATPVGPLVLLAATALASSICAATLLCANDQTPGWKLFSVSCKETLLGYRFC